jgi:FkbM family methyltransferase
LRKNPSNSSGDLAEQAGRHAAIRLTPRTALLSGAGTARAHPPRPAIILIMLRPDEHAETISLLPTLVRALIRANIRGSTRLTFFLASRFRSLQAVPITVNATQRFYVDLGDGLSHPLLAGSPWESVPWDVDEQIVMRRFVGPGDMVFDIGAHIGLHTVLLSELVGRSGEVHAFEANPAKIAPLRATAADRGNVVLHPVGVPDDQSMASLRDWTEGRVGAVHEMETKLNRLDGLIDSGVVPRPDFVKCDVEGGELRVFSGATQVLDRADAPIILYEANTLSTRAFGIRLSDATDRLRSMRRAEYSIFHVQGNGTLVRIETFSPNCDHYNLLAVPRQRANRLTS